MENFDSLGVSLASRLVGPCRRSGDRKLGGLEHLLVRYQENFWTISTHP